jgi:hypothetical protein
MRTATTTCDTTPARTRATRGTGELLVLAVGSLLVTSYLAHRYAYAYPFDRYQRHGDRMD